MKIDKWMIEDVAYTIKNFGSKIVEWEQQSYMEHKGKENPYIKAAKAALIVANQGFGDCFTIDDFIGYVEDGSFIDYDGTGYWVDGEGNRLGSIYCNVNWLKSNTPEGAEFIMWFNK